ncbi:MAG: hypothetical protein M5U09_29470, partial [Gammaproteobacteria bacterium]|nr:hypothetical protein [Gammaproteobacteria bacterium]
AGGETVRAAQQLRHRGCRAAGGRGSEALPEGHRGPRGGRGLRVRGAADRDLPAGRQTRHAEARISRAIYYTPYIVATDMWNLNEFRSSGWSGSGSSTRS